MEANANGHPAALPEEELLKNCSERHVRRSGPGGQNRNKVETGVILTHDPTGISAEASERRTQLENRRAAVMRLRRKLALEHRLPITGDRPSDRWHSRVTQRKLAVNARHDDVPALLAEALDWLDAHQWNVGDVAERLGVSPSQLVKFLKTEPRALQQLNAHREQLGLSAMK